MPLQPTPRWRDLTRSPIRQMTIECTRLGGVNLAQGICDTPVPEVVLAAARDAVAAGHNAYAPAEGVDELRRALAAHMRQRAGLDYDADDVIVTAGATGAFYVAALATLEPGDEVVLFEPSYGYHVHTLHALGAVPRFVPLTPGEWHLDLRALGAAIGPRTRGLVVNTPANPCGKVFTRQELAALGEIARAHDLIVFTDEVYEHFVYDGRTHVAPATIPGLRERTVGFDEELVRSAAEQRAPLADIGLSCRVDQLLSASLDHGARARAELDVELVGGGDPIVDAQQRASLVGQ
jgi:aminotransferase